MSSRRKPDEDTKRSTRTKPRVSRVPELPVQIYLRMRPLTETEKEDHEVNITNLLDDTTIAIRPPENSLAHKSGDYQEHRFTFNKIFNEETTQHVFFEQTAQKEAKMLFEDSKNSLIITYGCSGTGKSHTIQGKKSDPGIVDRLFSDLFERIAYYKDTIELRSNEEEMNHLLFMSYVEIYNEKVFDLLSDDPATRKPLKIQFDKNMKPCVEKLSEKPIKNIKQARKLINAGNNTRQSAQTAVNHESSRSHALLTIKLVSMPAGISKKQLMKNPEKYLHLRKLTVVDMAGNERSKRSKVSGARMKETSNINTSLMVFRNCIEALKANQQSKRSSIAPQVIPYRESKLTTLLKEYLSGNGQTSMIVCASPCGVDYDETINSLKFSATAKEVRTIQVPILAPVTPKASQIRQSSSRMTPRTASATPMRATPRRSTQQQQNKEVLLLRKQLEAAQHYCVNLEKNLRTEITTEFTEHYRTLQRFYETQMEQQRNQLTQEQTESFNSEMEVISHMNLLYQQQVDEIFNHPECYVTAPDQNDESVRLSEELENMKGKHLALSAEHQAALEISSTLKSEFEIEKSNLLSLKINLNNNIMENEQLRDLISSLENQQSQKSTQFIDESSSHSIERSESSKSLKKWKNKVSQLEEEKGSLMDQINDLKVVLKQQRKDLKSKNDSHAPSTPTRAIDRVFGILTPNSKSSRRQAIPTQLVHNDSSGNMHTWQGNANPSLTGDGVSVLYENIQTTKNMATSTFLEEPVAEGQLYSSPIEVLVKPRTKRMPQKQDAIMVTMEDDLSDSFAEEFMMSTFKKVGKQDRENIKPSNTGKRKSSDSFSEISLTLAAPPKKKARTNNTKKPLISTTKRTTRRTRQQAATESKTKSKPKTRTGTRAPSSRVK